VNIQLISTRSDTQQPILLVTGDVLTINGEAFDFSQVLDGDTLPADAVGSDFIVGDVTREASVLTVPVLLPHGPRAPQETRFPTDINAGDGLVRLPSYNGETQPVLAFAELSGAGQEVTVTGHYNITDGLSLLSEEFGYGGEGSPIAGGWAYTYGGTYTITYSVIATDGENETEAVHRTTVTIDGPARPEQSA